MEGFVFEIRIEPHERVRGEVLRDQHASVARGDRRRRGGKSSAHGNPARSLERVEDVAQRASELG